MENDDEKPRSASPNGAIEEEPRFEPIRTETLSKPTSRRSSLSRSNLSRIGSQNGYGVSDEPAADGEWPVDDEAQTNRPEKDPFEVSWDNGDNDPLCPRSFAKPRKWVIVAIVALASFCV